MRNKIVEYLGFKIFEGTMLVKDICPRGEVWSARVVSGVWLYLPTLDMWLHEESYTFYDSKRCEIAE